LIKRNEASCGTKLYKFPGELIDESDIEADNEPSKDDQSQSSDFTWSSNGGSFNSDKLIDGYKEFIVMN